MRYISPFHFIQEDILRYGLVDTNKIETELNELLCKIENSDVKSIQLFNKVLYKDDILNILYELNNPEILIIHAQIFRDKSLLRFLEDDNFTPILNATFNPHLSNTIALEFISPYYKNASFNTIKNAIEQIDIHTILQFFGISHLLTQQDWLDLKQRINDLLQLPINKINKIITNINENQFVSEDAIKLLELNKTIQVFNSFPSEFDSFRETLATDLNKLGCLLTHKEYYDFAITVFTAALALNTIPETKNQLSKNLNVVNNRNSNKNLKSNTKGKGKIAAVPIAFIVLIVVRIIFIFWRSSTTTNTRSIVDARYINEMINKPSTYDTTIYNNIEKKNSIKTGSTETITNDELAEPTNYAAFSYSNTSFDDFMTLLYNQSIMFSPTDRKQIVFKNGDNVYKQLFETSAFIVPNTKTIKGRTISTKTKTIKIFNNTNYECILITRNTILAVPIKFNSIYIPAKSIFNLIINDGYTDIRPYLGTKLLINKNYNRASIIERYINEDFVPPYLFETVPRKNKLLFGIGVVFDDIKDTNAKITIEQINDELVQNIDELKK